MELKYMNYFSVNDKQTIKSIYYNSFKKRERFPFWILKKCGKENNVEFNAILDGDGIIGFYYTIQYDNIAYLMYLAIKEDERNKGYGTKILANLIEKYNNIMLCIERPNKDIFSENTKRKQFYLRNHFYSSNKFIIDNNVEYEILITNRNCEVSIKNLQKRYTQMTSSKFIKFLISKMFNVYNIKFK